MGSKMDCYRLGIRTSQAVAENEKAPEKLGVPSVSEALKRRGQDLNLR